MNMRHLRSLTVAAGLVACASVFAQDKVISADFMAMPVDRVVAQLAELSGERLDASGTLKGEIVFLSVKDQSVTKIKAQLAQALDAEWRQEGDHWYLARSGVTEQRQKQKEIEARAARLKTELMKQVAENAKLAAFDAAEAQRLTEQFQTAMTNMQTAGPGGWRKFLELANQLPGGRTIISVVSNMNINDLAAIPAGGRRVFAVSPTRMQGQLPNGTMRLAQKMVNDQLVMEQTASQAFGDMASVMLNGGRQGPAPAGDVTNVLLIATRFGGGDTINLTLVAANQAGLALTSGNMTLGIPADPTTTPEPKLLGEGKPVTLRPESKELLALLRQPPRGGNVFFSGGGGNMTVTATATGSSLSGGAASPANSSAPVVLSDALRAKLQRPDQWDPMWFFVSDALKSIGAQHGRSVIAVLPDTAFQSLVNPLGQPDPKTDGVITALKNGDMEFKDEDGWVVATPKSPTAARDRVDRVAFARLLAAMQRNPVLSLDELADYFATAPSAGGFGFQGFETGFAMVLSGGGSFQEMMQTFGRDRDALRFYGRLTMPQRNALKSGGQMAIAGLSPAQREAADRLIFWSFDGPQKQQPNQGRGGGPQSMMQIRVGPGGGGMFGSQDPSNERTTLLPTGLPGNGVITMKGTTEQAVMARQKGGKATLLSIFQLAANRAALQGGAGGPGGFRMEGTQYDEYQIAGQMNYDLTFTVGPGYTLTRNLEDPLLDPSAKFMAYDQLPVPFRNAVTQAMQRFQQGGGPMGGVRINGGPGGPRPGGGGGPRP